jgi:hypothetical protein
LWLAAWEQTSKIFNNFFYGGIETFIDINASWGYHKKKNKKKGDLSVG